MFQDSLLETDVRDQKRRRFTTALSFSLESLLLSTLVVLPLFCTEALPTRIWPVRSVLAPTPAASGAQEFSRSSPRTPSSITYGEVRFLRTPRTTLPTDYGGGPPGPVPGGLQGIDGGSANGVLISILTVPGHSVPPPSPKPAKPIHVSQGVVQGMLIKQVKPEYPLLARKTRIQGAVVLHAIIARDGSVGNLEALSGHPFLVQAALAAVRQWRYRPYQLNGQPVEVDTIITVRFTMDGN